MGKRISRGYDFLARFYDLLAFALFGNRLKKCREALIQDLPSTGEALILGGGTGSFLRALAKTGKTRSILFVDLSPRMVEKARRGMKPTRLEAAHECSLEFQTANVLSLPSGPRFDLICTNFFLDSFEPAELKRITDHVHGMLCPDGLWYFSDFQGGPRPLLALLYWFFRVTCRISARRLPDYEGEFRRLGLVLEKEKWTANRMLRTAIYRKPIKPSASIQNFN